jgi:mono/diheme cytochrome c family protein
LSLLWFRGHFYIRVVPLEATTYGRYSNFTRLAVLIALVLAVVSFSAGVASAEDTATEAPVAEEPDGEAIEQTAEDLAAEEQLREGSAVYTQICASCHQAGGVGLTGQFPPLINNPRVDDSAYVDEVINNGVQGELVVDGVTYNGVMPSFSTLSDDDTAAVIAFIQNDFVAPVSAAAPPLGPVAGTELPALASLTAILAYATAAGLALLVLAPRIIGENDRLNFPWLDAWLRTAVIVCGVILLTVVIPDRVVRSGTVADLSRFFQDLIGVSVWMVGLVIVLSSLWYAHRKSRI